MAMDVVCYANPEKSEDSTVLLVFDSGLVRRLFSQAEIGFDGDLVRKLAELLNDEHPTFHRFSETPDAMPATMIYVVEAEAPLRTGPTNGCFFESQNLEGAPVLTGSKGQAGIVFRVSPEATARNIADTPGDLYLALEDTKSPENSYKVQFPPPQASTGKGIQGPMR